MNRKDRKLQKQKMRRERPTLPSLSRFTSERMLHEIHQAMEGREFANVEEMNSFLQTLMGEGLERALENKPRKDPQWRAQELAYQAMEAESASQAEALARRALEVDPDCVDALTTLAEVTAGSEEELLLMLRRAVEAGERSLGREFIEENRGHFWGITKTRPYMRARYHLTSALLSADRIAEACGHFEALLEFNPNDNQGVRDVLLSLYLMVDSLDGARRLLKQYAEDGSALFSWGRVLERHLSRDVYGASTALKEARRENRYVEKYLTGKKQQPLRLPDYYSRGEESEAVYCAFHLGLAWRLHPQAVNWLKSV